MNQILGSLVLQFREFWKGLTPTKRVSLVASTAIAALTLSVTLIMFSGSEFVPLFQNVPNDQVGIVINQLREKNVPFQMRDNGQTIVVPKEALHATQMALMAEIGGAQMGTIGLELFDKQEFGTTSYAQRINFQRALQGELIRAVNTLDAVKKSKVILAMPVKKVFMEENANATASVVIDLHPGKTLSSEQIRGIRYLVSSSVQNMDPENVTVVDDRGKVLSKHFDGDTRASNQMLDLRKKIETDLEKKIEEILSKAVGSGRVIAKVDASISQQVKTMVAESVDPDKTAVRSSVIQEESLDGSRTNPVGVPGARANLPGAGNAGQVGYNQDVSRETKTTNYAVPKTITNIREAAGGIERISVAVIVDGTTKMVEGEDGTLTEQWQKRTPEELIQYENLVKNAIGFSVKRGDSIKIENIRFQKEEFEEAERLISVLERKKLIHALFKWSLLGLSMALFFFLVVRPFMQWITDSFSDTVDEMLPRTIEELEELQHVDSTLPGMSGALPTLEEAMDPDKAESELLKDRIMAIMESSELKAAGAFGLWLVRRE